jgi:hypothetical protein
MTGIVWVIYVAALSGMPLKQAQDLPTFQTEESCRDYLKSAIVTGRLDFAPGTTGACVPRIYVEEDSK